MLNTSVPDKQTSFKADFFVIPGTADTLLGRRFSEELGVLKVGVSVFARESRNVNDKKGFPKGKVPTIV